MTSDRCFEVVRDHARKSLDPEDSRYVIADEKLLPLLGGRTRVRLTKLKRYCRPHVTPERKKRKRAGPDTRPAYSGHMCNLRVKILWPFKSITALENLATFLIETNRVDSNFLEPPRDRVTRTAKMFLEGELK